jgi:multidrug efflux pump subunit AcrA (membrane-fusion protein)
MPEKTTPEKVEAPNKDNEQNLSDKDKLRQLADEKRRIAAKKRRRKKIVKWSILTVLLLAIAGGIAYGVYNLFFIEEEIPDQTAFSYRGPFQSSISGYGQVKANRTEAVTVMARGELLELFVEEGSTVMVGEPLYRVDDTAVREAILTKEDELNALQASLDAIYEKLASLDIHAPFKGKLLDVRVSVGDVVSEGSEIATLVDDSRMRLKMYFSYGYENDIKQGQTARVSIPATMSVVSGKVVDNPGALTEGMEAIAELTASDGSLITPAESGVLEYNRTEKITSAASGKVVSMDMVEYYDYNSGALLCRLEGISYDEQIETLNEQMGLKTEEIAELQAQLDAFNATAPISGTVMSIAAQVGQVLEPGTAVLTISDTSSMTVEINIDERNINNIKVGMGAELRQDTAEGSNFFFGMVESVALEGKYDYGYAYFPAVISIQGGEGLYAGSSIYYNIVSSSKDDCILVPIQAVKYTESGTCVFVKAEEPPEGAIELPEGIVPDGYYAVPVVTGIGDTSVVEIVEGIGDGVELFLQPGIDPNQYGGIYY